MSTISTGFDALNTRLNTLFPSGSGWIELPNPYKPEENPDLYLRQSWGIVVGPAENSNRQVNCKFSVARTMTVVLARQYDALENDTSAKASTVKQLLEDQAVLINDMEQDVTVNGSTMYTRWESDGGIEYIKGETDRFLMIKTDFRLEYLETFT